MTLPHGYRHGYLPQRFLFGRAPVALAQRNTWRQTFCLLQHFLELWAAGGLAMLWVRPVCFFSGFLWLSAAEPSPGPAAQCLWDDSVPGGGREGQQPPARA